MFDNLILMNLPTFTGIFYDIIPNTKKITSPNRISIKNLFVWRV